MSEKIGKTHELLEAFVKKGTVTSQKLLFFYMQNDECTCAERDSVTEQSKWLNYNSNTIYSGKSHKVSQNIDSPTREETERFYFAISYPTYNLLQKEREDKQTHENH